MQWRESDGIRLLEAELPGARATFSSRLGGVSESPFDTLNLGILTGDERAAVRENRVRLAAALDSEPAMVLIGRQVHGSEIARHHRAQDPSPYAEPGSQIPEVDGHVISDPGLTALVMVADCLPVALAGAGKAAMLHCGWRGLAGGILTIGARATEAEAAAIGPGIGPCCYEVGDEVRERFAALGNGVSQGRMLDLAEVARRQLRAVGVERIESAGLCTSCERKLFFSHRRDGSQTGRQGGMVRLEPGA